MTRDEQAKHWHRLVLDAAIPFEAGWTWRKLANVNRDFHDRLRGQRDYFDTLLIDGTPKEIAEHGASTVQGYAKAVEIMSAHEPSRPERISLAKRGPSLQELVAQHGGYDKITAEAWERFDREVIVWKGKLRNGEFEREFDDPSQTEESLQ